MGQCCLRKVLYPVADLEMEVEGLYIKVEAVVSETLPTAVLLGREVPQLAQLLEKPLETYPVPEDVMVVVTRAQAKRQVQEEIERRERETSAGVVAKPLGVENQVEQQGTEQDQKSLPCTVR